MKIPQEIIKQLLQDLNEAESELEKEVSGISDELASKKIAPGT